MNERAFFVTYLDKADQVLFSEKVMAEDHWSACTYALHDNPKGAADFQVVDPEDPKTGEPPVALTVRPPGAHRRSKRLRWVNALHAQWAQKLAH